MPPQFAGGIIGGGGELGNASGHITLDISDLQRAEQASRTIGRNIEQNLNAVGRGASAVETAFVSANQAVTTFRNSFRASLSSANDLLRSFRGELVALGAGAGLTLGFGLRASQDIRAARIRLSQFVETEQEANDLMNMLANSAGEFGLELTGVLSLAGTLLPLLENNVEATNEWVLRAARLRTVLPTAQQGAELRAISEYLSGQSVSLQRLFNIPPSIIQEAKAQFQDAGEQVDYILDRMGATEEAARAMADPLVAVKNELKLIASTGFTPILERLREILPGFREWLENIRETRPEILELGGAFVTVAAVGAPLLLFLGSVLSTLQKIQALGALGLLGRAGLIGAVTLGGGAAAVGGLRAIGRATGDERLEDITGREALATALKAVVDIFLSFVSILGPILQDFTRRLLDFIDLFVLIYSGLGALYTRIGEILPDELGGDKFRRAGGIISDAGEEAAEFVEQLRQANESNMPRYLESINEARNAIDGWIDRLLGVVKDERPGGSKAGFVGSSSEGVRTLSELQLAQIEAWEQYQQSIIDIETRMQERRLQMIEQYEQQRTQIIARYEQTIAREAEDFARQRLRAEQDLQNDIADIQQEAAERERDWWQELNETIAELRADSTERIAEIEEEANRDRERMEREHRLNLMQAASRLDAAAVASEQMRFKNQVTNFEQDLQVRIQREQENLQERIQQEQEAHQERLEAARQADAERIEDLRESHAERIAIEDEDRAIRLRRMKEDHHQQLVELKRAHFDRLNELKRQAAQELGNLKEEFIRRSIELTNFYNQWITTQIDEQTRSLNQWEDFWKEWYSIQQEAGAPGGGRSGRGTSSVPPGATTPAVQGGVSVGAAAMWGASGNGQAYTTSTTASNMNANITINASPGQSVYDIGQAVEGVLIGLFRRMA